MNKIDRAGARYDGVLRSIAEKLTPAIVPLGTVAGHGTRAASFSPLGPGDQGFTTRLVELLAERDDALLATWAEGAAVPWRRLRGELAAQTGRALVYPVLLARRSPAPAAGR